MGALEGAQEGRRELSSLRACSHQIDWRTLKIAAPIFPTRANEPPAVSYEYTAGLVACSTPLPGGGRGQRPHPSMFLDVFEETKDMDPYSSIVLDEFGEL